MAILYVFSANDPNSAGVYPPSVVSSEWFTRVTNYYAANSIGGNNGPVAILFNDETALSAFLSEYRLTDASLVSDVNAWKTAHSVTYNTQYFALSNASISTPTPVIS